MNPQTFIIREQEFTCHRMNAFAANKLLLRIQKVAVPVIAAIASEDAGKNLMDMDVKEAAGLLSQHLDESLMDDIVLPMFAESKVFSASHKKFITKPIDIDQCFTTEYLFDMYELIFEVMKYQFGPFFVSLMERLGRAPASDVIPE